MSRDSAQRPRIISPYGPGINAFAISPHDTNQIQQDGEDVVLRAVYVGTGGNIAGRVYTPNGTPATVTFVGVPTGTVLNVAFTHIHSASTTADDMIGLL